jgi:hypothetical protein
LLEAEDGSNGVFLCATGDEAGDDVNDTHPLMARRLGTPSSAF